MPYLLTYFILLLVYSSKTLAVKKIHYILMFLLILLFYGLRQDVGWDWYNYQNAFYHHIKFHDIGFNFLQNIFFDISPHYATWQFFLAFLSMYILLKNSKQYSNDRQNLSLLIFFSIAMFAYFAILRQALAISIFYYSLIDIREKRFKSYFIKILLASLIHISLALAFPLYWILNRRFKLKYFLLLFFVSNLIYLLKINIIKYVIILTTYIDFFSNNIMVSYAQNSISVTSKYLYFAQTFIVLFCIIYYSKLINKRYFCIFFNLYFLGYIIRILLFTNYIFSGRVSEIFLISQTFLIPIVIATFKKKTQSALVTILILYLLISVIVYGKIFNYSGYNILLKYQSYICNNQNLINKKMKYINK